MFYFQKTRDGGMVGWGPGLTPPLLTFQPVAGSSIGFRQDLSSECRPSLRPRTLKGNIKKHFFPSRTMMRNVRR